MERAGPGADGDGAAAGRGACERLEETSSGSARRPRARLWREQVLPGDRRGHGLPGQYGQDASVPCAQAAGALPGRGAGRDEQESTPMSTEHERAGALLPWYVNATLSTQESALVEEHLRSCLACRQEV